MSLTSELITEPSKNFRVSSHAVFPTCAPDADRERRWAQADAWTDEQKQLLDALDREFYGLEEDPSGLLVAWARNNREKFS